MTADRHQAAGVRPPLSNGSVSLRLYPTDVPDGPAAATAVVDELVLQARLAEAAGFDGTMTSEHHAGWSGYLPNPIQVAGWVLEETSASWAAACPLLLPLRPVAIVAEEVAWQAARFPGRVGVGVAAGSVLEDFEVVGSTLEGMTQRFSDALAHLANLLAGRVPEGRIEELLHQDRAIQQCAGSPVPVVSAAMSPTACRRAARAQVGLLFDSLSTTDRVRELVDAYRGAGGVGPAILVRRAWVGPPPVREADRQVAFYRSYAGAAAQAHFGGNEMINADDAGSVAEGLLAAMRAAGADALNLRVHMPGLAPEAVRGQIEALGDVVTLLRGSIG